MLMQIWRHRVMVGGVIRRDLRTRYAGSALGVIWTLLQPLLYFALYLFVFSWIFQVKFTATAGSGDFAPYLLAGLMPWLSFQEGVLKAAGAIVEHASLVKGLRFPAVVLVFASVLASLVSFLVGLGLLLMLLALLGRLSWLTLPFVPLLVVLQSCLALGVGLLAASFYTFLRDTIQVLQVGFMIWFYLTPIIYPPSYVPDHLAFLFLWNPFTALVTAYRAVLLENAWPSMMTLVPLCVWVIGACVVGGLVFRKVAPGFADVL